MTEADHVKMAEADYAIVLANKILDRISADPDDDLAILARQLLRTREQLRLPPEEKLDEILAILKRIEERQIRTTGIVQAMEQSKQDVGTFASSDFGYKPR